MIALFYKLPQDITSRKDLLPSAKILYAVIVDRIGGNGRTWAGHRRLAKDTGMARSTIAAAVDSLQSAGLLIVETRNNGQSNLYSLPPETGPEIMPVLHDGERPNRPENQAGGGRKSGRYRHEIQARTRQTHITRGGAATPPVSEDKFHPTPDTPLGDHHGNGAGARLMVLWVQGFKNATGRNFPNSARGKTAGTLKRLISDHGEETLSAAVGKWFAVKRGDYGVELFSLRLSGGSVELLPPAPKEPTARELQDIENTRKLMEGTL